MLSYPVVDRDQQRLAQELNAAHLIRTDVTITKRPRRHLRWLPRLGRRTILSH